MTTFAKITNEDILLEVKALREDVSNMKIDIKLNRWIGTTALTIILSVSIAMIAVIAN